MKQSCSARELENCRKLTNGYVLTQDEYDRASNEFKTLIGPYRDNIDIMPEFATHGESSI